MVSSRPSQGRLPAKGAKRVRKATQIALTGAVGLWNALKPGRGGSTHLQGFASLDPVLITHLTDEFGEHGRRASEFLQTAHTIVRSRAPWPRAPETVAYCLREALSTIPSASAEREPRWSELSREVRLARDEYRRVAGGESEERTAALDHLLRRVDAMTAVHERATVREEQLIATMVARSGTRPVSMGSDPIGTYVRILRSANAALHGNCSWDEAMALWNDSITLMRQLFLPPEERLGRLRELAQVGTPSVSDVQAVLDLIATPTHLVHFVQCAESAVWLDLLSNHGLFAPPADNSTWGGFAAVERFGEGHAREIADWWADLYERHGTNPVGASYLAHAALEIGGTEGSKLILKCLRDHSEDANILSFGVRACEVVEADDPVVEDLADLILNEQSWSRVPFTAPLLEAFANGVTNGNVRQRLQLLRFKLQSLPDDDPARLRLAANPMRSIADHHPGLNESRGSAILNCLLSVLRAAPGILQLEDLLEAIEQFPEWLRDRLRVWLFGNSLAGTPSMLAAEVEARIKAGSPTKDDIALVNRASEIGDPTAHSDAWESALGEPPSADEMRVAASTREVPRGWWRSLEWAGLLPEYAHGGWMAVREAVATFHSVPTRESLEQEGTAIWVTGRSVYEPSWFRGRSPTDAAQEIASWRPNRASLENGAREIAHALEDAVKEEPAAWTLDPTHIARTLRHPTYINHYIQALISLEREHRISVRDALEVVELVRSHPWEVVPIGRDRFDYDPDWRGAERSAVDLVRSLVESDGDLGDYTDDVWEVFSSTARDRSEPSPASAGEEWDPLTRALNRSCTRALQGVLSFLAAEHRANSTVRFDAVALLEECLRLEGDDGAEHRAVLAPAMGLLRHVLPEWTERNGELIFGERAPGDLGQVTLDLALRWGRPNTWILEGWPEGVKEAVRRGVEHALEHVLIAMLLETPGYSVGSVLEFVRRQDLGPQAARDLSRVCQGDNLRPDHAAIAIDYWRAALKAGVGLAGFGWLSTVGLEQGPWENLTLETLRHSQGEIDLSGSVAKRVMEAAPSTLGLAILDQLVRGSMQDWERRSIATQAGRYLSSVPRQLRVTSEFQRLRTALIERGAIDGV